MAFPIQLANSRVSSEGPKTDSDIFPLASLLKKLGGGEVFTVIPGDKLLDGISTDSSFFIERHVTP